jgi:ankyrin repeat protein
LHWASIRGALKVARLLLEHGADVDATDYSGEIALQHAVHGGHDEIVELL